MAAARGPNEGAWVALGDPDHAWSSFLPQVGDVIEFETALVPPHYGVGGLGAFLVVKVEEAADGSLLLSGRCVGCNDEEIGKVLSSLLNRRQGVLHVCRESPCSLPEEERAIHVMKARWFERTGFNEEYMKPWGKQMLKEYDTETTAPARRGALKKPAPRRRPGGGEAKEPLRGDAKTDGLREKLRRLRGNSGGRGKKRPATPIEVIESGDSAEDREARSSSSDEATEEVPSDGAAVPRTSLALMDQVKAEASAGDGDSVKKKKKKKKVKVRRPKDPGMQLLAQAAQMRETRKEAKGKKEKRSQKSSGSGQVKALLKALTGGKEKSKGKGSSASRKRKAKPGDGDGGGSSSEDSSRESGDEDDGSSSSSELLAPLQKKSSRKPGAVLKLLVQHAKHMMDQTAIVESQQDQDVTGGIKMTSYFNLLIRPYHPSSSRDMKELNHLSICLDELRAGDLGKLGDSLASRFLALHTAVNEGNWRAAQFLELHPLEPSSGAPAALLLEARRHGKVVQKAQGSEDWKRSRYEQESWQGGTKGKGGKPKGKGKGKDWSRAGKGDQTWQGGGGNWNKNPKNNWWASQQEKPDSKDTKNSDKEGKK